MKILLAQTDAANLEMIKSILLSEKHELSSVSDGIELLIAMQENPDLVIVDANLPEINGYECCRLIKHDENNQHTSVILLMPTQDFVALTRLSGCGADDFLKHPLHPHVVKSKIQPLLRLSKLRQQLNQQPLKNKIQG
jgi:DNA-binding response OmpR family regulator